MKDNVRALDTHRAVTLDDVAERPALAADLSPAKCHALALQAAAVLAAVSQRMAGLADGEDAALTAEDVAPLFRMNVKTLYEKARKDPRFMALVIDMGDASLLRFSRRRVQARLAGQG